MVASSESGLLWISSGAWAPVSRWTGDQVSPVLTSCSTKCRWLKVPRSLSWPVSRIGTPSSSMDPNASASAWPQSMPPGAEMSCRRRSSWRASFGWTVNPSGQVSSCSLSASRNSAGSAVSTLLASGSGATGASGRERGGGLHGLLDLHQPLVGLLRLAVSASAALSSPSLTSCAAYRARTVGRSLIRAYMTGWV